MKMSSMSHGYMAKLPPRNTINNLNLGVRRSLATKRRPSLQPPWVLPKRRRGVAALLHYEHRLAVLALGITPVVISISGISSMVLAIASRPVRYAQSGSMPISRVCRDRSGAWTYGGAAATYRAKPRANRLQGLF